MEKYRLRVTDKKFVFQGEPGEYETVTVEHDYTCTFGELFELLHYMAKCSDYEINCTISRIDGEEDGKE